MEHSSHAGSRRFRTRAAYQRLAWSHFAWLAVAACSDEHTTPAYEVACDRNCARAHECSSSIDLEDCAASCKRNLDDVGPHLRTEYLAGIDKCVTDQSCTELALGSILNTCPNQARAELAPSDAAKDLCERVASSLKECTGLDVGTAGCLDTAKIFDDASLRNASACEKKPCDQRAGCLQDALGRDLSGT